MAPFFIVIALLVASVILAFVAAHDLTRRAEKLKCAILEKRNSRKDSSTASR